MPSSPARWIWQTAIWPPLAFDAQAITTPLSNARHELGRLIGKVEAVGLADAALTERDIWTQDALATAAIEGEMLNLDAVRSSVARRLGIAADFPAAIPRNVEGLLDVMQDAATNWAVPLTEDRLCAWHVELFPFAQISLRPIKVGRYRSDASPMQIVSGPLGRESVHYEVPPAADVPAQMSQFIDWFNRTRRNDNYGTNADSNDNSATDGLIRAALAHLWFESIHPFEDGNGRIGRAIVDLALSQDTGRAFRLHGLSVELRRRQSEYYEALNRVQRAEADPTTWLQWLLDTLQRSCLASSRLVDEALQRAQFWSTHKHVQINERQRKLLNKMLEAGPGKFEGGMTPRKAQSLTGAAGATATRDLTELVEKGLMVRRGAGRSTHYELALAGWEWQAAGDINENARPQ